MNPILYIEGLIESYKQQVKDHETYQLNIAKNQFSQKL